MKQRLLAAAIGVPLLILVLVFLPPIATAKPLPKPCFGS